MSSEKKCVLITGSTGLIGGAIARLMPDEFTVFYTSTNRVLGGGSYHHPHDLRELAGIPELLSSIAPDVIIHTAAIGSVDRAEMNQLEARTLNVDATEAIARWCGVHDKRLIHFSSDFVFGGTRLDYNEQDEVAPLSWYGKTKVMSENVVRGLVNDHVIIRPILVYGVNPNQNRLNLPLLIQAKLSQGQKMQITSDQVRMPTYVDDVAGAVIKLINHEFKGVMHLAGQETMNMYEFALEVANVFDLNKALIEPVSTTTMQQAGKRPMLSGFDLNLAKSEIAFKPFTTNAALQAMKAQQLH